MAVEQDKELVRRAAIQRLEALQRAGVKQLPKSNQFDAEATCDVLNEHHCDSQDVPTSSSPSLAADALAIVEQEVKDCTLCRELAQSRKQTVFGVGNPQARLCFIGEAPGADEDRLGEPFVGKAGKLLNKILEACGLRRDDVYILNILKCRPPGNRNPTPIEADNCSGFLIRQLEIVQPEFICCLGGVAVTNLLETKLSIGRMRGKLHLWRGIKVVVSYHPAYLLRNPSAKKQTWEDMKFLLNEMGLEVPQQNK